VALPNIVKNAIRAGFRKAAKVHYVLRWREYRYVFILGHMRSGSTVLSHILTSHPDFVGAGETHTKYETLADLPKLIPKTCELLRKIELGNTNYIVDQINHPYVIHQVLSSPTIYKCIIIIRAPEAALKSLMALFGWNEKRALECYVGRLAQISQYGWNLRERAMLVEYDDLVERTEDTLGALTRFLAVDPPFKSDYSKSKVTWKMGDPSKNIFSGRIIRTKGHDKSISTQAMTQAANAFCQCRQELLSAGVLPAIGKDPVPQAQRII
jgi:hypothetical protein